MKSDYSANGLAVVGERLGARLVSGDIAVVDDLLGTYQATLARRLKKKYGRIVPHEDLEEIALNTVHEAWRHRADFDAEIGSLEAWLWVIADHAAAAVVRKPWCRERRQECGVDFDQLRLAPDRPHDEPTNESCMPDEVRLSPLMERAMGVLTCHERAIVRIEICSLEGAISSEQLASELGLAPSTVRRYRARAYAKLKAELEKPEYADLRRRGGGACPFGR